MGRRTARYQGVRPCEHSQYFKTDTTHLGGPNAQSLWTKATCQQTSSVLVEGGGVLYPLERIWTESSFFAHCGHSCFHLYHSAAVIHLSANMQRQTGHRQRASNVLSLGLFLNAITLSTFMGLAILMKLRSYMKKILLRICTEQELKHMYIYLYKYIQIYIKNLHSQSKTMIYMLQHNVSTTWPGLNISYSAYRKSVGCAQGLGHLYHINYIFLIIHLKSQRCKKS